MLNHLTDQIGSFSTNLNNNIDYFKNTVNEFYKDFSYKLGDICIFNTNTPIELLISYGLNPKYMLGGTLNFENTYDDIFPRDVDKVVQSSYTIFKEFTKSYTNQVLAIIVLINDSYRKLANQLEEEGVKVIKIDYFQSIVSGNYNYKRIVKKYKNELMLLTKKLILPKETIINNTRLFHSIREKLDIIKNYSLKIKVMNIYDYLIICSSYYYTNDYDSYNYNLEQFIKTFNQNTYKEDTLKVSLIGSPVFYPNTKVVDLLTEFNVEVFLFDNELNYYLSNHTNYNTDYYTYILNQYFNKDDFTKNIKDQVKLNSNYDKVDGFVYIVLKGNVVSDFNYDKYSNYLDNKPLLKLETDYFNEDIEQLKIRIEAFVEMLRHRKDV